MSTPTIKRCAVSARHFTRSPLARKRSAKSALALLAGLAVGCGGGGDDGGGDGGTGLNMNNTVWSGTVNYHFESASGQTKLNSSTTVTITATQIGNIVSYAGTQGNGVTWSCQGGTMNNTTVAFSSCTVENTVGCTAIVTDRSDLIDDTGTPWTMAPSYHYVWTGASCAVVGGGTTTVGAPGMAATLLTRQ